jgi:hypothetical protein
MKRAITYAVLALTVSLFCSRVNAQCSQGGNGNESCDSGGGYPGGNGGGFGGGYDGGGYSTPPYVDPYSNGPATGVGPEPTLPYTDETGDYGVYIQHPLNGNYVLSKDFTNKGQAEDYVSAVERRFWVTYRVGEGDLEFKEAQTSSEARSIANQLRSQGNEVTQFIPINARIGKPDDEGLNLELFASSDKPRAEQTETGTEVVEGSTTPSDLSFLVGAWQAVARNENGELTKIELRLDENGWATLTVPGQDGDTSSTRRRAELKDGQLVLTGEGNDINLGKLASFDKNQVILDRLFGQITFVRP